MIRALILLVALVAAPLVVRADDVSITLPPDPPYATLRPGAGVEAAQRSCALCHSTDYIVMQPHGDLKQWDGVVTKMIKVFGAPVNDTDAKTIAEYLAREYGK
jgi:sulfite dehydrogenase (cytochrome) subunit B